MKRGAKRSKSTVSSVIELVADHRSSRVGLALRHPGMGRQAVPHPQRLDGADAGDRPARARQPHRHALRRTARRRDRRVPPARRRRAGGLRAAAARRARRRGLLAAGAQAGRASTSSSASSPAPATRSTIVEGHVIRNGKREADSYIRPCAGRLGVQLPDADQDSRRSLVHDGRQPWRIRRQQVLGTSPHRMDHRRRLRHLLAARPHRHPLAPRRRPTWPARAAPRRASRTAARHGPRPARARRSGSGRRLFAFDRRLGVPLVAGADEAGRGCLAGPLVAAGVLFDYEALTTRELRSLSALNDSKQHTARGARAALSARAAQRSARRRRLALRARDRRARAAQDQPGGAARRADRRHARRARRRAVPARRLLRAATSAARSARSSTATPPARRSPPRRSSPRSRATATCTTPTASIPGWSFAEHVGYSTPVHREAILRQGVSPLHRMSFQSLAYQQLAL